MSRTRLVAFLVSLAVVLALVLGTLGLHREVLLGRSVYHMDDAADGYYPSHVAITRALEAGRLPLWERNASAGWPLIADPYYGTFYPPNVLFARSLFGPVRGLGFSIALHVLGAGLFMYWLLRRRQLPPAVALLGAASLAFGGFMVVRIRHIIFAQMMAYLPLLLCGVEGFLNTRRVRELVLIAAALGLSLLCGALPLLPYAALLITAYVLPRCLRAEATWRGRIAVLAPLGAAALCGLLLAGAQLVPTVAHLPQTPRSLGASFQFAASYAWPDWGYVGTLLLPDLYGGEQRHEWFGRFNHWEMAGYYAGAWVVLLAPLALVLVRGRRRAELWGLALVSGLAVLLALGTRTPLLRWFFDHVPLFGALRCPTRALIMWLLAAPILAAEALHAHLAEPVHDRRRGSVAFALLLALGGAAGFFALRRGVHAPNVAATLRAFAHFTLVLGLGAAVLLLRRGGRLRAPAAAWALSLLTLVECVALGRTWVQPKPADWAPGTERFAALDWLLLQPRPEGSAVADRMSPLAEGPFRLLNAGMTYDRESASGYDSMLVWRYGHLIWILNNGRPYPHKLLEHDLAATVVKNWSSPLVDLLNIRYILAPYALQPHWIERYAPRTTEPLHARHEPLWDRQLRVFENPRALPRAFVLYDFEVHPDDAQHAQALTRLDPRKKVLLDREPVPAPPTTPADRERPLVPARVTRADATRVRIEAVTDVPGVLVLSETSYPGWTATLDGREVPILRADYAFRGVALPAGRHVVEMSYRSRPVELGLLATGLGGLGLIVLIGAGSIAGSSARSTRRRRSGDGPAPAAPAAAAEPSPTASPPGT